MNYAAKVLIKDSTSNSYLVLYRANHPIFGKSVDLPGGTVEKGETGIQAAVREVFEETNVNINENDLKLLADSTEYSRHNTRYALFSVEVTARPSIVVSWEHESYDWVPLERLQKECMESNDQFMYMVADCLRKLS